MNHTVKSNLPPTGSVAILNLSCWLPAGLMAMRGGLWFGDDTGVKSWAIKPFTARFRLGGCLIRVNP